MLRFVTLLHFLQNNFSSWNTALPTIAQPSSTKQFIIAFFDLRDTFFNELTVSIYFYLIYKRYRISCLFNSPRYDATEERFHLVH